MIFGRLNSLSDYQDTTDTSVQYIDIRLAGYDPARDVAIIELVAANASFSIGYSLEGTDSTSTGTPVVSLGFPHTDSGRLVLTQQASMVGARVLLGNSGLKTKHVILNTQTRPGQSGGPVLSPDGRRVHAMIVGGYVPAAGVQAVVAGINVQVLHQTTHAVSAEYIRAMIQ